MSNNVRVVPEGNQSFRASWMPWLVIAAVVVLVILVVVAVALAITFGYVSLPAIPSFDGVGSLLPWWGWLLVGLLGGAVLLAAVLIFVIPNELAGQFVQIENSPFVMAATGILPFAIGAVVLAIGLIMALLDAISRLSIPWWATGSFVVGLVLVAPLSYLWWKHR
ncbi:hypothetical protein HY045_03340 [Candidatus Woesebacteria bacterium]|nr:hypothetical protein [Candidatus Woesebacteria bacterium]